MRCVFFCLFFAFLFPGRPIVSGTCRPELTTANTMGVNLGICYVYPGEGGILQIGLTNHRDTLLMIHAIERPTAFLCSRAEISFYTEHGDSIGVKTCALSERVNGGMYERNRYRIAAGKTFWLCVDPDAAAVERATGKRVGELRVRLVLDGCFSDGWCGVFEDRVCLPTGAGRGTPVRVERMLKANWQFR